MLARRVPIEVVFADVDMMGHVNNAMYFTYFETARTAYFLALSDRDAPWQASELDFIVARASCEFRRALRWGEKGEVVVWPTHVGTTSFTFGYVLLDGSGKVSAQGETVQVSFDYGKGAKKPIPAALRARLEAELKAGLPRDVDDAVKRAAGAAAAAPPAARRTTSR